MKPIKVLELLEVDCLKLEKGYHNGPTHLLYKQDFGSVGTNLFVNYSYLYN